MKIPLKSGSIVKVRCLRVFTAQVGGRRVKFGVHYSYSRVNMLTLSHYPSGMIVTEFPAYELVFSRETYEQAGRRHLQRFIDQAGSGWLLEVFDAEKRINK